MTAVEDRPGTDPSATSSKVDPETLALRAQPARAIRFKRGAIVAIAALGSVSLIATTWIALRPTALHLAGQTDDQTVAAKPPTDALSGLPGSYGDVPRLGPALPGDLGRPILEHQRAMATEPAGGEAARADQAAATERDRRAAELRAARESGLLVQSGNRAAPTANVEAPQSSLAATTAEPRGRTCRSDGRAACCVAAVPRTMPSPTSARAAEHLSSDSSIATVSSFWYPAFITSAGEETRWPH